MKKHLWQYCRFSILFILLFFGIQLFGVRKGLDSASASKALPQQNPTVDSFLYPPYPGSVLENSIFDHSVPDYSMTDEKIISFTGYEAQMDPDAVCSNPPDPDIDPPDCRGVYYSQSLEFDLSYNGHPGIDYNTDYLPIFAAADSNQVLDSRWNYEQDHRFGLGLFVRLYHPPHGYDTIYGHLSATAVTTCVTPECPTVGQGDEIGISGNTGNSTGPHLHFEVRNPVGVSIDPYGWDPDTTSEIQNDPWPDTWRANPNASLWLVSPELNDMQTVLPTDQGYPLHFPAFPRTGVIVDDDAHGSSPDFTKAENCWIVPSEDLTGKAIYNDSLYAPAVLEIENPCWAKWSLPANQPSGYYAVYVNIPRTVSSLADGVEYQVYSGDVLTATLTINQREIYYWVLGPSYSYSADPTVDAGWIYIGTYRFDREGANYIRVSNDVQGPTRNPLYPYEVVNNPHVFVDAVQFVPVSIGVADVALIIDSSGSMGWNDPQDKRLAAARGYAWTASQPGDFVAVVDFDSDARVASPLQRIPEYKDILLAAINSIDSSGGTNVGLGVQTGCDVLQASHRPTVAKGAILLTDGVGSFSGQDQCFVEHGWPIYTFGFGEADEVLLQSIALNTGGEFKHIDNVTQLPCEFARVRALIAGVVPSPCIPVDVPYLGTISLPAMIPPGQAQATFTTSWPGSDVVMTLTTPSGRVIDRNTVAPDVVHYLESGFESYSISYPEPGEWQVSLFGADVPPEGEQVIFGFTTVPAPEPTTCQPSNVYGSSQGGSQARLASHIASDVTDFQRLPLSFVPNLGQDDQAVRFQAQGLGGRLFFTSAEVVFSLPNPVKTSAENGDEAEKIRYDLRPSNVVRLHYQGANPQPEIAGVGELPGVVNYLKGNDPSRWRTNLPTYSGIAYRELYPGVDLRYEGTGGRLKSLFYVAPGADPSHIVWRYKGADDVRLDESGNLVLSLPAPVEGENGALLIERAPLAWQEVDGVRVPLTVQYALDKNDKVSFLFPEGYDPAWPLVIDPELAYSTYLGGGRDDEGNALTLDADCNVYLTGSTYSSDFPTADPMQTNLPGRDVFVTRLDAAGEALLYSTYLGGDQNDSAWGIVLDSAGRVTLVGETESSDFPTLNAYDATYGGGACGGGPCDDVFVAQLTPDGAGLRYSTYLGSSGDDEATAMALGPGDQVYLTGSTNSIDFPAVNAYDDTFGGGTCDNVPCLDGFVARVDPAGSGASSLLYSTYLGGSKYDKSKAIAVDAGGRVYVTGYAYSNNFPVLNPFQSVRAGSSDVFVTKLDPALSGAASLLYSTYLGGSQSDNAAGIALGGADQVYLTGFTNSANFPLSNAFDATLDGACGSGTCLDAFATHLDIASNSLVYSSYLGGAAEERGSGITVDEAGSAYVTGYTLSTDFPVMDAIQAVKGSEACSDPPCADAFVTRVSAAGNALIYSTYLGGGGEDYGNAIVLDGLGGTYITGYTFSSDFPTTPGAYDTLIASSYSDAFVVKIGD